MNGIIQYVSFCVRFLSLSIMQDIPIEYKTREILLDLITFKSKLKDYLSQSL